MSDRADGASVLATRDPGRPNQTRVTVFRGKDRPDGDAALSAYGELYSRVQWKLFAEVMAGRPAASLKNPYLRKYGIPARMFNAVRVSLEGKASRKAQKLRLDTLQRRIARAERQISDAGEQSRWQQVHQKRRRLANLQSRLAGLEADIAAGASTALFRVKAAVAQAASPGDQRLRQP